MAAISSGVTSSPPPAPASPSPLAGTGPAFGVLVPFGTESRPSMSNCGPLIEKYTSKAVSNARQCADDFTSVAPEGVLDGLAVLEGQMADRLGGVGRLGHRHGQAGAAKLLTKPVRTSSTTPIASRHRSCQPAVTTPAWRS